jgi:hypothetical protein
MSIFICAGFATLGSPVSFRIVIRVLHISIIIENSDSKFVLERILILAFN